MLEVPPFDLLLAARVTVGLSKVSCGNSQRYRLKGSSWSYAAYLGKESI